MENVLEDDPVAEAVRSLMEDCKKWQGTATDLLSKLEGKPNTTIPGHVTERVVNTKIWPKTAGKLSGRLKRASNALSHVGIKIVFDQRTAKRRIIVITREK